MTIAYICLIISIFIPIFCTGYAKISQKGYNNHEPRKFQENLEGKAKRAHFAQLNSYEAFPPFAAAILVAHQMHAPQLRIDLLAISFVLIRILYVIFYIYDLPTLRSISWFLGLLLTISLFFTIL